MRTSLGMLSEQMTTDLTSDVVNDFIERGYHIFSERIDSDPLENMLRALHADRDFGENLFLSEAEFDKDPQYVGVNPRPGRNFTERLRKELAAVEATPHIVRALEALLGPDHAILDRKFVCGVPAKSVPEWIKKRITDNPVNNLGAYIKPEYRDLTYFYGIDFHQDLIDHKDREADFITLYIYLHPVSRMDAPLYVLENSHKLGATVFPHDLSRADQGVRIYRDQRGGEVRTRQIVLTGETGYAATWHACTLHGTQPDAADNERISLRYLLAKNCQGKVGIDRVNDTLQGPIALSSTRVDLAADGSAQIKGNVIVNTA